ncbi:MAG TPA: alpha/beta hydrolase-fold protein [Nocardioides sp.]
MATRNGFVAVLATLLLGLGLVACGGVLLLDSGGRDRRWAEMGADGDAAAWLAQRLVPWAREQWVLGPASDVVVAGQSLGAMTALRAVLGHGDVVGGAVAQSASLWQDDLADLVEGRDLTGRRVHVEVGTQEWVLHGPNRDLAGRLERAGATVRYVEFDGGHDYACWRGGLADAVARLLGPDPSA